MTKGGIILLVIFLIGFVSATCNLSQVNINTASPEELDKIINVGPATALKIIANRTYSSVDDLIRVKGIGNVTLEQIKRQELACVGEVIKEEVKEENGSSKEETNSDAGETTSSQEETNLPEENKTQNQIKEETIELPVISLNSNSILSDSKDIKTENNKEILKRNLPLYGIIAFCAVFGTAFFLKRRKNKHGFE
jgi:competence ComEA-like helix-hairpin-helix protein